MNRRSAASLASALVCTGLLVLTGCSSSGGDGNANVDVTTVPLQPGDLPAAWKGSAHNTSDDAADDAASKKLAACAGGKDTSSALIKHVYSDDYAMGSASITSDAQEFTSSSDVDTDAKLFSSSKIKSCTEQQFLATATRNLPSDAKIGTFNFTITRGSNGGPSNVVATMKIVVPITAQGQTITVYDTSVAIRGNRIEATIDFTGVGKPIATSTITKAVAAVAKRARG